MRNRPLFNDAKAQKLTLNAALTPIKRRLLLSIFRLAIEYSGLYKSSPLDEYIHTADGPTAICTAENNSYRKLPTNDSIC